MPDDIYIYIYIYIYGDLTYPIINLKKKKLLKFYNNYTKIITRQYIFDMQRIKKLKKWSSSTKARKVTE